MIVRMRYRHFVTGFSLGVLFSCAGGPHPATTIGPVQSRMYSDLTYLAGPALAGRLTGTPGNDSAAAFIARRYGQLKMMGPFNGTSCGMDKCENSFFQFFRVGPYTLGHLDIAVKERTQNVGALVSGTDSLLGHEYVVVGAHYDHLGRSNTYARDASPFAVVHPGADDNGSGTVAVLELARRFVERPARRSVLFLNFSAEELGLVGSEVFLEHSPVPPGAIVAMVNLDMVGRLRGDRMILFSGEDHDRFRTLVDSVERISPPMQFHFQWEPGSRGVSDQASFAAAHIPVLGLFTDYHVDYHRSGDIVDRINFRGLEKIVDFTERFVRAVADGKEIPAEATQNAFPRF